MKGGLEAPPETKRGAPLRARSYALVSGLVLLWCLPMEPATNAAALLNEELRAPCHCTDEASHAEDTDQRATIELPRAPTPFEDAVPTRLPEQRAEGTSGKEPPRPGAAAPPCCSVVPVAPPLPLTLLQLVLLAVMAWRRAPRGNTSTARAVLPTLLCLLVPKALAQQCASAPTCPEYSWQSGLASGTCTLKQYGTMMNFEANVLMATTTGWRRKQPTILPGRGLYRIWKVSKDESNCCYDLEVQGFMCEVMKNKTAVRASPAVLLRARQTPSHRSEPSLPDARRCTTQP